MKCPSIQELPAPPPGKSGWPWTVTGESKVGGAEYGWWPRVSLVMPCLNAARYIEEALRSILLQDYPDLEVLMLDGGSSDGTIEIIRRYEPWLTFWASEKDSGQSHAINKGLQRVTGELFNWFNADDVMCPQGLAALVGQYQSRPDSAGVCGAVLQFDEQGAESILRPVPGDSNQLSYWLDPWILPQPSSLYRTAYCRQVGGVDERLHYMMDMDLVVKLAALGQIAVTDRVICRFRCHPGSKTVQGYYGGLVELVVSNFERGQGRAAEAMLQRRMEGHANLAIGRLTEGDIAKMVDEWGYGRLARYIARRLLKNIRLRMPLGRVS